MSYKNKINRLKVIDWVHVVLYFFSCKRNIYFFMYTVMNMLQKFSGKKNKIKYNAF